MFFSLRSVKCALLLASIFFVGCTTPTLNVQLNASDKLNEDVTGTSYAVMVRFYQLSEPTLFEKANITALLREDESVLSATLLSKKEFLITPGTQTEIVLPKIDESAYLGVAAFFRDDDTGQQMMVSKVRSGKIALSTTLQLMLDGNKISLIR